MRFKRIDNNSIRCIISQEEMDEHGIAIDDLMDDRNKAETFLRYVLQQAHDEIDFEMTGNMLNVQLSIMPDGDVSLMITDNERSALKNIISQFRDSLKMVKEALEEKKNSLTDASKVLEEYKEALPDKKSLGKSHADDPFRVTVWTELPSLESGILLVQAVPSIVGRESTLFKYKDTYYLRMEMDGTRKEAASLAFTMSEYVTVLYGETPAVYDVIEHGKVIIDTEATKKLAQL